MNKKIKAIALIILSLCVMLCSCGGQLDPNNAVQDSSQPATVPANPRNPLTGLYGYAPEAVGKRPVAVTVNNVFDSLPQYGISDADIIYEFPVEGGITRLLALYADVSTVNKVMSVRSARYYLAETALGYDAIYVHWGSDAMYALPMMNDSGMDRLDGNVESMGAAFFDRDTTLDRASEHTGYISGEGLRSAISEYGFRTELTEDKNRPAFSFNEPDAPQNAGDTACTSFTVNFSNDYYSTFTYYPDEKLYYKRHSGSGHMDALTDTQLSFTNVLVLEAEVTSLYPDGDDYYSLLRKIDMSGGSGYYFSNGTYKSINWTKGDAADPLVITDDSGATQTVNAGKTFICVMPQYSTIDIG